MDHVTLRRMAKNLRAAETPLAKADGYIKVAIPTSSHIADMLEELASAKERDLSPNQIF